MRYTIGLLASIALLIIVGCSSPTGPSPTLSVTPSVVHMQVGQTQVFTFEGGSGLDKNFTPLLPTTMARVTYTPNTVSVTYLAKSTIPTATLRIYYHRSGKEDLVAEATIYFD